MRYKMPFYDNDFEKPTWASTIEKENILLSKPLQYCRIWIDEISTFKGAKWAYNTSCKMLNQFAFLSEGIIKITCDDYVKSFKEL